MNHTNGDKKLYHKDLHIPAGFEKPVYEGRLYYSQHAKDEAQKDRYGNFPLPYYFHARGATLIEVETENGKPVKQVWRQPLDMERDLVLVITKEGRVKTVWVNLVNDPHNTLRAENYEFAHLAKHSRR